VGDIREAAIAVSRVAILGRDMSQTESGERIYIKWERERPCRLYLSCKILDNLTSKPVMLFSERRKEAEPLR
jgi:hypothetical protein